MYADRVKDTTAAPGTGTVTLANVAPAGYQTFATAFTTGTLVSYCIADQAGTRWEVGTGTFTAPATLTRTTVLASSASGAAVNFSTGTQDVFCTAPAKYLDTFTSTNPGVVPASSGGTTNFLRADGSFAAPPTTAPAGSNTQIQYNNGTTFAASSTFTYTVGTSRLSVPNLTLTSGSLISSAPFTLNVTGGDATYACAGNLVFYSTGAVGQNITFTAGSGVAGGQIQLNGGLGSTSQGGSFQLYGGDSASDIGGDCIFFPGIGPVANGSLILSDGNIYLVQCQYDTATSQSRMGFFNAAPVAQPTTATASATRAAVIGTVANVGDTYDGYTLAKVVKALRNLGILA